MHCEAHHLLRSFIFTKKESSKNTNKIQIPVKF